MADAPRRILVSGGTGYIGSHTVLALVEAGYEVTVFDNLCNSKPESLRRVRRLSGKPEAIEFVEADMLDLDAMKAVATKHDYFACIHFAGLKAVGESVAKPVWYYDNNITGTLNLVKAMAEAGVKRIVFSSSATVYGSATPPVTEESPTGVGITNPYGQTKFMLEQVLRDVHTADKSWGVVLLRYFNPVGAHASGDIGEDPNGMPNNLMPFIQQVAVGRRERLTVFGDDYDTPDGTAQRDYIHVVDLAAGHVKALQWLERHPDGACEVFNLGTGTPRSVLEMVAGMEKACGHEIARVMGARRDGDLPAIWAVTDKAREELGWVAEKTIDDMCADSWRWQSKNPMGLPAEGEPAGDGGGAGASAATEASS